MAASPTLVYSYKLTPCDFSLEQQPSSPKVDVNLTEDDLTRLLEQRNIFQIHNPERIDFTRWKDISDIFWISAFPGAAKNFENNTIVLPERWTIIKRPPINSLQESGAHHGFSATSIRDSTNIPRAEKCFFRFSSVVTLYSFESGKDILKAEESYASLTQSLLAAKEKTISEIQLSRSINWSASHPFAVFYIKDMSSRRQNGGESSFAAVRYSCQGFFPTEEAAQKLKEFLSENKEYEFSERKDEIVISRIDVLSKKFYPSTSIHFQVSLNSYRINDNFFETNWVRKTEYNWKEEFRSIL